MGYFRTIFGFGEGFVALYVSSVVVFAIRFVLHSFFSYGYVLLRVQIGMTLFRYMAYVFGFFDLLSLKLVSLE